VQSLTQLLVALLELLEAEGRAFRVGIGKAAMAIMFLLVAALLALGGFGMLVWAVFLGFAAIPLAAGWAAFWTGIVTLAGAGVLMWLAKTAAK